MVAICIVAFVSGHLLSNLDPAHRSQRPRIDPALNRRLPITPEDLVVGFLMLVATSLVLYEWYAMVNSRSLVAITYYVRCANVIANYRTMAMAAAFTFVVGTWLRFPWWRS